MYNNNKINYFKTAAVALAVYAAPCYASEMPGIDKIQSMNGQPVGYHMTSPKVQGLDNLKVDGAKIEGLDGQKTTLTGAVPNPQTQVKGLTDLVL
jgi:hypothetical protein